ncbi:MAG TPA: hypothetical protein VN028_02070 [Rhodocyclaceae bacterium]|nr:hypothetical protein [Rhodocyclaceae bacterium]
MQSTLLLAAILLTACTTEQAYYAGQLWQGSQCSQLADKQDYDACMQRNRGDYDSYRKERDKR